MRYILSCYSSSVWGECVKLVLTKSIPPLINNKTCVEVLENAKMYQQYAEQDDNVQELYAEFIKTFESLSMTSYRAVGELCALVRDCSSTPAHTAQVLGPLVLLNPGMDMGSENISAARFIFQKMVEDCETLFGQSAARSTTCFGLGIRKHVVSRFNPSQWNRDHFVTNDVKWRKDLRTFYSYVDKRYIVIVDALFVFHEFTDIAHALFLKYHMIPQPWRRKLQNLKLKGERLDWFNHETIETPNPGGDRVHHVKSKISARTNSKSSADSYNSVHRSRSKHPHKVIARDLYPIDLGIKIDTPMNHLVDRFIDIEWDYFRGIRDFGFLYLNGIRDIANGLKGHPEMMALNLDVNEINLIFGERWRNILEFSRTLLVQLEPIKLLRTPLVPESGTNRVAYLAQTIIRLTAPGDLYTSYAAFSISYPQVDAIINKKIKVRKTVLGKSGKNHLAHPDFFDLWDKYRHHISSLKMKSLPEVFDLPTVHIRQYKDILEKIASHYAPESVEFKLLNTAFDNVNATAKRLTEASLASRKYRGALKREKSLMETV
mmetsp:Transcript_17042/g.20502  ORF Transcript_17042/g.20502 Transcript_17042/m.20502 type:complete len:546 (+) Transcript_17042:105-1742(+)